MMFPQDRTELRKFYQSAWARFENKEILTPLESQVVEIIQWHPEYLKFLLNLNEDLLDQDFSVEQGEVNPFLHLGLHLGLREQIQTDRPLGISKIYHALLNKTKNPHEAEHRMMDILGEVLWLSQKYNTQPEDKFYLDKLKNLIV